MRVMGVLSAMAVCGMVAAAEQPPQTSTISGTIVNADGERLRPVRAVVRRDGDGGVSATTWSSTKDGRFTILNLEPGDYRLFLEALPFETLKGRPIRHFAGMRVTVASDIGDLKVVAAPGVTIEGRLVPHDRLRAEDLRNRWVVAAGPDERALALAMVGPDLTFTLTDVFGPVRFGLADVPDGSAIDAVWLGDANVTGKFVEVEPGEARELRIVLRRGG
jgi:hypothetical protein